MNNNIINNLIQGDYLNISNIFRHSGLKTIGSENVAEHSYFVSLISDILMQDILNKHMNIKIDKYKVLKYAIYHDFEETFTGDIITTLKESNEDFRAILEDVSKKVFKKELNKIFKGQDFLQENILDTHHEYEIGKYKNLENQIVKFADMLQFLIFSIEQYNLGNKNYKKMIKIIPLRIQSKNFNPLYFSEYIKGIIEITEKIISD